MEKILDFIKKHKLINAGEVIGVGVSGGIDSMSLLHFLNEHKEKLDIEVVAIHINHGIREESDDEAYFVLQKCREMGVRIYKFTIDAPKLARDKKLSIETAAREGRYGVFETLVRKDIVDKDYKDLCAEMYSEGHSFFTYISDSADSLASCCRLRNELTENTFNPTSGLTGVMTGSCNVITLNINRIVQD